MIKYVVHHDIILGYLNNQKYKNIIDFFIFNKNGFISTNSLPKILSKYSSSEKLLKNFTVWKTPSYVNLNHPFFKKFPEDYLLFLTAKSLNGYLLVNNKELLSFSKKILYVDDFLIKKSKKEISFIDLNSQNLKVFPQIEKKIDKIISTSKFVSGDYVEKFEKKFSEYLNTKYCVCVNSGTSALILSLMSIGLKPDDEVIMPVNTFIATAEAVSFLKAKPVFVDIHPDYYTINTSLIEEKITKKTKAIIPVHLYGQCADMDTILKIAKKYNLWVIEDACQAHGALYKNKKAGTKGDLGCFSFYPSKNLGSFGEGGAIVTNNEDLAYKLKLLRNHGEESKYYHVIIGGNFRMTEIQAAVLLEKLNFLDKWNNMRREIAKKYSELLNTKKIILPKVAPCNKHIYHLYVIQVSDRDNVIKKLKEKKINSAIHYPYTLNLQPPYRKKGKFKIAENISNKILSLPMHPYLKENEIINITSTLNKIIENK